MLNLSMRLLDATHGHGIGAGSSVRSFVLLSSGHYWFRREGGSLTSGDALRKIILICIRILIVLFPQLDYLIPG